MEELTLSHSNIVIAGDFNSNLLSDDNFALAMNNLGLVSVNCSMPTHFTRTNSSLLDLFFVSDKTKVLLYDQLSLPSFSNHDLIFLTFDFEFTRKNSFYSYRDFAHINYDELGKSVDLINWASVRCLTSPNDQIDFIQTHISNLFDKFVPLITKSNIRKSRPWFNGNIKLLIKKRNSLYQSWKRYKTEALYGNYKILKSEVTKAIKYQKLNTMNIYSALQ